MEIPAIVLECERLGVAVLGITDHVNSLDDLDRHLPIKTDIGVLETGVDVYFGVELNFPGADESFPYSAEIRERYGFQFAIGGIHDAYLEGYDLKKLVDIQHRHHLKTCRDPLVDVLVHPYWFGKSTFEANGWPWFDSMQAVPESYARELGQTARETGTAIEMNACAILDSPAYSGQFVEEYVAFLSSIAEEGACFALGSDAHDIGRLRAIRTAWEVAEQLNLGSDRIWSPPCKPMANRRSQHSGKPS